MSYRPKPLLTIDVPKSSLSVRPGSVLEIEDKIVLFGIACLIAPLLDRKLPGNVYSWRVKEGTKGKGLFHDHEILKFPFLKSRTIRKRIEFVEPWYGVWPRFIQDLEYAYEKEGYQFLVVSDIVAYFENIDLDLLRNLLLQYLPRQHRIINFLISLLEYWTWPAVHRASAPRGIPQGNEVSSFLGNIYLLPLDRAFIAFAKRRDLKYLRYMDDIKVLARDMSSARDALFLMNEELRSLRLNIQGSKTRILQGPEIRGEFIDDRLHAVNEIIMKVQKKKTMTPAERTAYLADLKKYLSSVRGRKGIVRGNELRLFRRLMTGFTLPRHSGMVRPVLDQVERNPDSALLGSSVRYLRAQDRNLKKIAERVAGFLTQDGGLFPYQKANFFMILRYMRNIPSEAWKEARRQVSIKKNHWYVRQQAAILIGLKKMSKREVDAVSRLYEREENTEVKRGWIIALSQLPRENLEEITRTLIFAADPKLQRVGRFYHGLLFDRAKGMEQVKSIFNNFTEDTLLEWFYEVEVLSKTKDTHIKTTLLKHLRKARRSVRRPLLKDRVEQNLERLREH